MRHGSWSVLKLIRWPVLIGLILGCCLQLVAAFTDVVKPQAVGLPDVLPPIQTAVLALLWWRMSQVEKDRDYFRDRIDELKHPEPRPRRRRRDRHGEDPLDPLDPLA